MGGRTRARRETSAGGVVFRCADGCPHYLLILDSYRNWGFPKGHVDDGEAPQDAARREVREETGLENLVLHDSLGVIDWHFRFRGRLIHKFCHFFLFESTGGEASPQLREGITACEWRPLDAALETIAYRNTRGILESGADAASALCGKRRPAADG